MKNLKLAVRVYTALVESTSTVTPATLWSWDETRKALLASPHPKLVEELEGMGAGRRERVLRYAGAFAPLTPLGETFVFGDKSQVRKFADEVYAGGGMTQELAPGVVVADGIDREAIKLAAAKRGGVHYDGPNILDAFESVDTELPGDMIDGGVPAYVMEAALLDALDGKLVNETAYEPHTPFRGRLEKWARPRPSVLGIDARLVEGLVKARMLRPSVVKALVERAPVVMKRLVAEAEPPVANGGTATATDAQPASGTEAAPQGAGGSVAASQTAPTPEKTPPTDQVAANPPEEGGATGAVKLADGTVVPQDVLKKAMAKLLSNLATQLEQGTVGGQPEGKPAEQPEGEEKPAEEPPAEKPAEDKPAEAPAAAPAAPAAAPPAAEKPAAEPKKESVVHDEKQILAEARAFLGMKPTSTPAPAAPRAPVAPKAPAPKKESVFEGRSSAEILDVLRAINDLHPSSASSEAVRAFESFVRTGVTQHLSVVERAVRAALVMIERKHDTETATMVKSIFEDIAALRKTGVVESDIDGDAPARTGPRTPSPVLPPRAWPGVTVLRQNPTDKSAWESFTAALAQKGKSARVVVNGKIGVVTEVLEGLLRVRWHGGGSGQVSMSAVDRGSIGTYESMPAPARPVQEQLDVGQNDESAAAAKGFADAAEALKACRQAAFELTTASLVRLESLVQAVGAKKSGKMLAKVRDGTASFLDELKALAEQLDQAHETFKSESGTGAEAAQAQAQAAAPAAAPATPAPTPAAPTAESMIRQAVSRLVSTTLPERIAEGATTHEVSNAILARCGDLKLDTRMVMEVYARLRKAELVGSLRTYRVTIAEADHALLAQIGSPIAARTKDVRTTLVTENELREASKKLRASKSEDAEMFADTLDELRESALVGALNG
jgi:hypothetical protein